jgi:hypothetical protein
LVGAVGGLPGQSYYDPALADHNGQLHLLHVLALDIAMTPIDPNTGQPTGPFQVIALGARPGATANSPTPVVDSTGQVIGISHHDVLGGDNDHYMSLDLDPNTPAVLMNDTTTWTNNGGWCGGRFFDAVSSPSPYHIFSMDTFWTTGGRARIGTNMEIKAFSPPTAGADVYVTNLLVSVGFLAAGQSFPAPIRGMLGLNAAVLIAIQLPPHNNQNGETVLNLAVPNDPALSGKRLPCQSATLHVNGGTLSFGNTAALTIL